MRFTARATIIAPAAKLKSLLYTVIRCSDERTEGSRLITGGTFGHTGDKRLRCCIADEVQFGLQPRDEG